MFKQIALGAVIVGSLLTVGSVAEAATYVRGHYRSNGSYVQPHYRSYQDNSFNNNWSTRGNYNPYTGSRGYRTYRPYSYSRRWGW